MAAAYNGNSACSHGQHPQQGKYRRAVYILKNNPATAGFLQYGSEDQNCSQDCSCPECSVFLDGFNEFYYGIAVLLAQLAELLYRLACVTLRIAVPHDGLYHVTGAGIVQAVAVSRAYQGQTSAPERGRAAPSAADIVLHEKLVLDQVAVRPDSLVGIFRQLCIAAGEKVIGIVELVRSGSP